MGKTNGKAHPTAEAVTLSLSKPEQTALRKHDGGLVQMKVELANVDLQLAALEARRAELRAAIMAAGQRYQDDLRAMARTKGMDVERGVELDVAKMTLTGAKI